MIGKILGLLLLSCALVMLGGQTFLGVLFAIIGVEILLRDRSGI